MKTLATWFALSLCVLILGAPGAYAQGSGDAKPDALKVTVTLSRFEGEKKTASLPFVLWVNTNGERAVVRMGNQVPVPTTTMREGAAVDSYSYRNLGTNIEARAFRVEQGLYRVSLTVQDSQVFRAGEAGTPGAGFPQAVFQEFQATNEPMLRDGQSVEYAVATDKTNGEVIKLQVTLNVVK